MTRASGLLLGFRAPLDPCARARAGRLGAMVFTWGGVLALATLWLLPKGIGHAPVAVVGVLALLVGLAFRRLPWERLHPWWSLVPPVLALVAITAVGSLSPGSAAYYLQGYPLVFALVGLTQNPGRAVLLAPAAVASFAVAEGFAGPAALQFGLALPVWVMIAELLAHSAARQRRMEAVLRQSEERFRKVFEEAPVGVVLVGPDLHLVRANESFCRTVGYSEEELSGLTFADITHSEDVDLDGELAGRLFSGEISGYQVEKRCLTRSGEVIWVNLKATVSRDEEGRCSHGLAIVEDVTGRKQADEALRESERQLAEAQRLAGIGSWQWDVAADLVTWSEELQRICGVEQGRFEASSEGVIRLVHPEDAPVLRQAVERTCRTGESFQFEHRIIRPDGSTRLLHARGEVVLAPDGRPIRMFGTGQDITVARQAEAALREANERFRLAFENGPIGKALVAPDGRWLRVNRALCDILGHSEEELLSRNLRDLTHPDDLPGDAVDLDPVLDGEVPSYSIEKQYLHPAGNVVWVNLSVSLVRDDEGVPLYFIAQIEDCSERRRAADALRESEERYRLLVENAKDYAIFMLDSEGRVVSWNAGAERIHGYQAHDITGGHFSRFYAEEDAGQGKPEQGLAMAVAHRRFEDEGWRVRADGSRFWANVVITTLHDDTGGLRGFAIVSRDITERKQAEERMAHDALHDPLTGLPNRALFLDRLTLALTRLERHPSSLAVLFLDLDRFKVVNDSLGHRVGDELLVAVARRLRDAVRPGDTVARLGGDEFTILCEGMASELEASNLARRIAEVLRPPITVASGEVFTTASIGITLSNRSDDRPDNLLRDADAAMYAAKERGRDRHELFDQALRHRASTRLRLENDLRRGIERGELRLLYQPSVRLDTGAVSGVEALVRWEHPERGLVAPGEFIPLAEETGLIVPIGSWVLEEACRQAERWRALRPGQPPLLTTVNLSARQLIGADLLNTVARILSATHVDPATICLEITETVLMEDVDFYTEALLGLKALGVRLGIDDFGTGYSSLTYLKRFPVSVLKIDQSFVRGLGRDHYDAAIVRAVIDLARVLALEVVAEGVETAEHLAELRSLGCHIAQGYYFSRPQPAEALTELLVRNLPLVPELGPLAGRAPDRPLVPLAAPAPKR